MLVKSMERTLNLLRRRSQAQHTAANAVSLAAAAVHSEKLHLACGPNLKDGWINVDLEARAGAYQWDLREPLPFHDESIGVVFAEHFIEHITLDEGESLMRDCHRVLKPGGVVRLSTPDLEYMVGEYQAGRIDEWANMGWLPSSPCRMLNEGMRLWGHQFLYDRREMHAMLTRAGFATVRDSPWRSSTVPAFVDAEGRPHHHELIVEAVRA